jgi:hypothetical protein
MGKEFTGTLRVLRQRAREQVVLRAKTQSQAEQFLRGGIRLLRFLEFPIPGGINPVELLRALANQLLEDANLLLFSRPRELGAKHRGQNLLQMLPLPEDDLRPAKACWADELLAHVCARHNPIPAFLEDPNDYVCQFAQDLVLSQASSLDQ